VSGAGSAGPQEGAGAGSAGPQDGAGAGSAGQQDGATPPLLGPRRVRALFAHHGIRPHKALGQNFVIDPNTIRKVLRVSGLSQDDGVLEIGAGVGSLTLGLAASAGRVVAVELDGRLLGALREVLSAVDNVEIIQADAEKLDFGSIDASKLVANLPYNIATHVVLRVLEGAPQIDRLTVMVQKEVGERLAAPPGSKIYGLTTVLVASWGAAEIVGPVSRRAFWPVPEVDSVLVRIIRRREPPPVDRSTLDAVVRAAFAQRRKTLRSALVPAFGSAAAAAAACERAGVSPSARAEQVGLEGFVALAQAL